MSDVPHRGTRREQSARILQAFRSAHESTFADETDPTVPNRLYHYTTLQGLVGITTSGVMWASDARFLNDASELDYASRLIDEVVLAEIAGVTDDQLARVLPKAPGAANAFSLPFRRPFIACFSAWGDQLSQWRGYGHGDIPVSLGLDLSTLVRVGALPPNVLLARVLYDEAEQRERVRHITTTWLDTAQSLLQAGTGFTAQDLFPIPAIWALQEALAKEHLYFKNPAFSEEREWRLIKLVNVHAELRRLSDQRFSDRMSEMREQVRGLGVDLPDVSPRPNGFDEAEGVDLKFRESTMGLVPYVELPLRDVAGVFGGRLPLWEVVQGPTAHPELSLESLSTFLDANGYGFHTEVKASQVPLRQ